MACTLSSFTHVDGTTATSAVTLTVAAGESVAAYIHITPGSVTAATSFKWNSSESLTQIDTGRLWYIKAPTSGTHNLSMTLASDPAGRIGLSAWVVAGMDQTTSVRASSTGNQTSQTDPASAVGDLVIGGMTADHGDTNTWGANASATTDANVNTNPGTGASTSFWMLAEHEAGAAGTTPMSFQHVVNGGDGAQMKADFVALIAAGGGGGSVSGAGYYLRRRHAA